MTPPPGTPEPGPPAPPPPPPASPPAQASAAGWSGAGCVLFVLLALLLAGAGWYYLASQPRLRFTNQLAAPVRLKMAEGEARTVEAGESAVVRAPRDRTLVAEWEMIRPLSADSQPMGETVKGAVVLRGARGTVEGKASPRTGEADYFAPLITNAGSEAIRVVVNAGLQGARDCGCAVRPGATRVFIGYYRLYLNSTVRARDVSSGREATFRDLGPEVKSAAGTVGLRFEDRDLRLR